jgi:thymidylate synthase (FAD)
MQGEAMKQVQPGWVIDDMPDGERALAKIERLGRIAYKSEDKIDPGVRQRVFELGAEEPTTVWTRPPSSHAFVRMILQAEQKARMVIAAEKLMEEAHMGEPPTVLAFDDLRRALADKIVSNVYDYMKDNPAHESVIEHCSATVIFDTNRGVSHEIVRHRLASFTQESTRYCNYGKDKFDRQVQFIERTFWGKVQDRYKLECAADIWKKVMETSEWGYLELLKLGFEPQIARDCLTNALKTTIGTTANFREWRLIFKMRDSNKAHPDMRQLITPLHEEFRRRVPIVFD